MQAIAREANLNETTFPTQTGEDSYEMRTRRGPAAPAPPFRQRLRRRRPKAANPPLIRKPAIAAPSRTGRR